MAQHDYVIDNSTGANVRADINNALLAISSNNSGSSAPSTTYALQSFANTTTTMLQLRNAANNAFVNLRKFDGSLPLPDGSVSSPSLFFDDDTNTGIFSSAENKINFTTGGTEKFEIGSETIFNENGEDIDFRIEGDTDANLFHVDAGNDRVGISTSTPDCEFHVAGKVKTSGLGVNIVPIDGVQVHVEVANPRMMLKSTGTNAAKFMFGDQSNNDAGVIEYAHSSNVMAFSTGTLERFRVDSAGTFMIGTTSVLVGGTERPLQIQNTGGPKIALGRNDTSISAGNTIGGIEFYGNDANGTFVNTAAIIVNADGDHGDNDKPTRMEFSTTADGGSSTSERMRIDSSGRVGIAQTPVSDKLEVGGAIRSTSASANFSAGAEAVFMDFIPSTNGRIGTITGTGSARDLAFNIGNLEKMRIDTSGRLVVGASSARANFAWTTSAGIQAEGAFNKGSISSTNNENNANSCAFTSAKIRGTNAVATGDNVGSHVFEGYDGGAFRRLARISCLVHGGVASNDISGELQFLTRQTTNAEANRMTIASDGKLECFGDRANSIAQLFQNINGTSPEGILIQFTQAAPNTSSRHFLKCNDNVGDKMVIDTNGNLRNLNNSYGGFSDISLKENIVDAESQWDDIKNVKVRVFNFKTDDASEKRIGVVAQEIETVCPKLVDEVFDKDDNGNLLETSQKSVKYSVLYMKAIKALQEAITKIEVLETKVAALEAA